MVGGPGREQRDVVAEVGREVMRVRALRRHGVLDSMIPG
jgi:hypothetical protein